MYFPKPRPGRKRGEVRGGGFITIFPSAAPCLVSPPYNREKRILCPNKTCSHVSWQSYYYSPLSSPWPTWTYCVYNHTGWRVEIHKGKGRRAFGLEERERENKVGFPWPHQVGFGVGFAKYWHIDIVLFCVDFWTYIAYRCLSTILPTPEPECGVLYLRLKFRMSIPACLWQRGKRWSRTHFASPFRSPCVSVCLEQELNINDLFERRA